VFVLDIRHGVSGLEIMDSSPGAGWAAGVRQAYNAFVVQPGSAMVLPFSARLTSITGQVITATDVITDLAGHSSFDLGTQFAACSLFADGFESGGTATWSAASP